MNHRWWPLKRILKTEDLMDLQTSNFFPAHGREEIKMKVRKFRNIWKTLALYVSQMKSSGTYFTFIASSAETRVQSSIIVKRENRKCCMYFWINAMFHQKTSVETIRMRSHRVKYIAKGSPRDSLRNFQEIIKEFQEVSNEFSINLQGILKIVSQA